VTALPTTITAVHKAAVDPSTAELLADARWFPLRYDVASDAVIFAWIPQETHRALTFISDYRPTEIRAVPRATLEPPSGTAPLHIIVHSGLGGSTLLARALAEPGVVTTLKEPPILTDVVAFSLQSAGDETRGLLRQVASLLARSFVGGEAVVCKMSSVGNGLAAAIGEIRADTRILCLQTPLDQFLASLTAKGAEGRAGARRLFVGLRNSRMTCVTLSHAELQNHSDLQLAALAWLSIQKMILDAAWAFGPERVRSLDSNELLNNPPGSLRAIADHFRLSLDVEARLASGVFSRHAKTGEPFDTRKRATALSKTLQDHGSEIFPIVEWAREASKAIGLAWGLPQPLLDSAS
jgi:hypothetical protein